MKGPAALPWIATLADHAGILVGIDGTVTTISGLKPVAPVTRWSSLASTE